MAARRTPPATGSKPEVEEQENEAETAAEAEAAPAAPSTDNVGDISVEVNVEDLIAQIEAESKTAAAPSGSARRKIEDILEEKRIAKEIMDLDDFDIED